MTIKEAWRNLREMKAQIDPEHFPEAADFLYAEEEKIKNSKFNYESHCED
jgi:hypothetical protein